MRMWNAIRHPRQYAANQRYASWVAEHEAAVQVEAEQDEMYEEGEDEAYLEAKAAEAPRHEMGEDYYTQPVGSDRHRAAYREYLEATGGPTKGWTAEQEYVADNYAELMYDRWQDQMEAQDAVRDPDRHIYRWDAIGPNGEPKSGSTVMKDRSLAQMVDGMHQAGYKELTVMDETGGWVGGITPARPGMPSEPWHIPNGGYQLQQQIQMEP
jgi:hypothetical protein